MQGDIERVELAIIRDAAMGMLGVAQMTAQIDWFGCDECGMAYSFVLKAQVHADDCPWVKALEASEEVTDE